MAVDFCDYFWGEEHNGWNVLYQNMRLGQTATKELTDFFKERWSIDETYAKSLNKLAQRVGGGQGAVSGNVIGNVERWGSFAPVFGVLRAACEQLASVHLSVVAKLQDLVKELNKYQEQMHRKHKQVKDEESHTEDLVKNIQSTSLMAQKAKENYSQRCQDLERVRREGASPKDLEKAEAKLRKSYDEYKHLLDKYNNIREDFEKCMTVSCKRFQEVEDQHLTRLLQSVREFVRVLGGSSEAVAQIQHDMQRHFSKHSVLSLLDAFALNKYTGLEKPSKRDLRVVFFLGVRVGPYAMVFEDGGSLGSGVLGPDQQSPELGSNTRAQSSSSLQQPDQQSSKSSAEEITSAGGGGGGVLAGGMALFSTPLRRGVGQSVSGLPTCNLVKPSSGGSCVSLDVRGSSRDGPRVRDLGAEVSHVRGKLSVCGVSCASVCCGAELPADGVVCSVSGGGGGGGGACVKNTCDVRGQGEAGDLVQDSSQCGFSHGTQCLPSENKPEEASAKIKEFTEGPDKTNEIRMLQLCTELNCDNYGYFSQCSDHSSLPTRSALEEVHTSHGVCSDGGVNGSGNSKKELNDHQTKSQTFRGGINFGLNDEKNISLENEAAGAMGSSEALNSEVWFDARFEDPDSIIGQELNDSSDECAEVTQLLCPSGEEFEDSIPNSNREALSFVSEGCREGELKNTTTPKTGSLSSPPVDPLDDLSCFQWQSSVSPKRSAVRKSVWRTHIRSDRDSVIGGLSLFLRKSKSPELRGASSINTKVKPLETLPFREAAGSSLTSGSVLEHNSSVLKKPQDDEVKYARKHGWESPSLGVSSTESPTTVDSGRSANTSSNASSPHRSRLGSIASALSAARFSKGSRDARKKGKENKAVEYVLPACKSTDAKVLAERSAPNESKSESLSTPFSVHQEVGDSLKASGKGAFKRDKGSYPTFRFSKSKKDTKQAKDSKTVKQARETKKVATSKKESSGVVEKNTNILYSIPINFREWRLSKSPARQQAVGGPNLESLLQDNVDQTSACGDVERSLGTGENGDGCCRVTSCEDIKLGSGSDGERSYNNEQLQQECNGKPQNISTKFIPEENSGKLDTDCSEVRASSEAECQVPQPLVSLGELHRDNKHTMKVSGFHPYRASADDSKIRAYSAKLDHSASAGGGLSFPTLVLRSSSNNLAESVSPCDDSNAALCSDVENLTEVHGSPIFTIAHSGSGGANLHRRYSASLQHLNAVRESDKLVKSSFSGMNHFLSMTHLPSKLSQDCKRDECAFHSRIVPRTHVTSENLDTSLDSAESPTGNERGRGNISFHSSYLDLYVSPKGELMSLSEKRIRRRLSAEVSIESIAFGSPTTSGRGNKYLETPPCNANLRIVSNVSHYADYAQSRSQEVDTSANESPVQNFGICFRELTDRISGSKSKTEESLSIVSKSEDASEGSLVLVSSKAEEKMCGSGGSSFENKVSTDELSSPAIGSTLPCLKSLPSKVPDSIVSSSFLLPDTDSTLLQPPDSHSGGRFMTSSPGVSLSWGTDLGKNFDLSGLDICLVSDAYRGGDCDDYNDDCVRSNDLSDCSVIRGNDCGHDLDCGNDNFDRADDVGKKCDTGDCKCNNSSCNTCGRDVLDVVFSIENSNKYKTSHEDKKESAGVDEPISLLPPGQQASTHPPMNIFHSEQLSSQPINDGQRPVTVDLSSDEHLIKNSLVSQHTRIESSQLRRALSCDGLLGYSADLPPPVPFRRAMNRSLPALPQGGGRLLPPPPPIPVRLSLRRGKLPPPTGPRAQQEGSKSKAPAPVAAKFFDHQPAGDSKANLTESTALGSNSFQQFDKPSSDEVNIQLSLEKASKHSKLEGQSEQSLKKTVVQDSDINVQHSLMADCDLHSSREHSSSEAFIVHSITDASTKPCDDHSASEEPDPHSIDLDDSTSKSAPVSERVSPDTPAHSLLCLSSVENSGPSTPLSGAVAQLESSCSVGTGVCVFRPCNLKSSEADFCACHVSSPCIVDEICISPDESKVLSVSSSINTQFFSSSEDFTEGANASGPCSLKIAELRVLTGETQAENKEPVNADRTHPDSNETSSSPENFGSVSESSLPIDLTLESENSVGQEGVAESVLLPNQETRISSETVDIEPLKSLITERFEMPLESISVTSKPTVPLDSDLDVRKINDSHLESTTRDISGVSAATDISGASAATNISGASAATDDSDEDEDRFLDAFADFDCSRSRKKPPGQSCTQNWLNFDDRVVLSSCSFDVAQSSVCSPRAFQLADEDRHSPALALRTATTEIQPKASNARLPDDFFTGRFLSDRFPNADPNEFPDVPLVAQNDPWSSAVAGGGGAESSIAAKCCGFASDGEDPWAGAKLNFEGQFSRNSPNVDASSSGLSFHEDVSDFKGLSVRSLTTNSDIDDECSEEVSETVECDTESAMAEAVAISTSPKQRSFWPFKQQPKQPTSVKVQVHSNKKMLGSSLKQKQISDKQVKTAQNLLEVAQKRPPFMGDNFDCAPTPLSAVRSESPLEICHLPPGEASFSTWSSSTSTSTMSWSTSVAAPSTSVATPSTSVAAPSTSVAAPSTSVAAPSTSVAAPSTSVAAPSTSVEVPSTSVEVPSTSVEVPSTSVEVPSTSVEVPSTSVEVPSTSVEVSSTSVEVSSTSVEVSSTSVGAPSNTSTAVSISTLVSSTQISPVTTMSTHASSPTVTKSSDSFFSDLKRATPTTSKAGRNASPGPQKDASGRETPVEDLRCASPASTDSLSRSILARSSKYDIIQVLNVEADNIEVLQLNDNDYDVDDKHGMSSNSLCPCISNSCRLYNLILFFSLRSSPHPNPITPTPSPQPHHTSPITPAPSPQPHHTSPITPNVMSST
ncbi:FCH domain [Trinorchestia longiramus]|nr:FCH domain [Trinorchestia longiramus]